MPDFKRFFSILKENWKQPSNRKDIISFFISIGIFLISFIAYHFWGNYVLQALGITNTIMWGILFLVIMLVAGFLVFKSLFLLAAELSLLIFLVQSLCSVPGHSIESNDAMKHLLAIGLLYVIIKFFHSLYTDLKEYYKKIEHEKRSTSKILLIFLFIAFIFWFLWEIYQVINPIIRNLCIYH